MYAKVADLPHVLQQALKSVGYGKKDIEVKTAETVRLSLQGGDGYRAFSTLVNLSTGQYETTMGSWGGSNMFNPSNPVDNDRQAYALPQGGAVIKGIEGGGRPVLATITLHPANVVPWLPATTELTEVERKTLACFKGRKPGPYRNDALANAGSTPAIVDSLMVRGYLSRNRAGATQITTEGRNACEGVRL